MNTNNITRDVAVIVTSVTVATLGSKAPLASFGASGRRLRRIQGLDRGEIVFTPRFCGSNRLEGGKIFFLANRRLGSFEFGLINSQGLL